MEYYEFGKKISKIRKSQKISQETLCRDLHISRATISNLENGGVVDIGFKKVLQILDYLGYDIFLKEKFKFPVFEDLIESNSI